MVEVRIRLKSGQVIQSRSPNLLRPAADRRDAGFPCRLAVLVQLRRIPMLLKIFGTPHLDYPVVFADADEYRPAVGTYVVLPFPIRPLMAASTGVCTLPSELFPKPTALHTA